MATIKNASIADFMAAIIGITREEAEEKGICVSCRKPVTGFKDNISKQEYQISGLCQQCQDAVFG